MKRFITVYFILFSTISYAEDFTYELFVPKSKLSQVPLLVALHGCDQTHSNFRNETQLDIAAESVGFAVLYPNQISSRNKLRCWNWFQRDDKKPNFIEAESIINLIQKVRVSNPKLTGKVYVAGLAAGGALAGYLASCYPNTFSGVAVHSSVSYLRANNEAQGLRLMQQGQMANLAPIHTCAGFRRTPTLVIHGGRDSLVHTSNSKLILDDLAERNKSYLVWIPDLGHAWSGGLSGKYTNAMTPSASVAIFRFFIDQEK